jgi:DNA-binding transcriptional LysR family regulator
MVKAAADTGAGKKGAGVSEDLSDLRGRMLARQKRSRVRSRAVGSLVLAAVASGLGLAVVPLWQHADSWKPVASHAGSVIQAGWQDLFGVPAGDSPRRADPEPPAAD